MTAIALDLSLPQTPALRSYDAQIIRLSRASVRKHFDAYEDVEWDEHAVDPTDPRFERNENDPLGATDWYRSLPQSQRARLGLHLAVRQMHVGVHFEGILSQGLLAFAATLPCGASELRYSLHEVIEEGQHSLMFQEFVARSGLEVQGITGVRRRLANRIPALGRTFPELFFIHVLAGEAPIDGIQRRELTRADLHPLLRRIMRIHVLEEARHMCFAENFLREHVPQLGVLRRASLAIQTPFALATTADQMLHIPAPMAAQYSMPSAVVRGAFRGSRELQCRTAEDLAPVTALCRELGILNSGTEWLWRRLGLLTAESLPCLPAG